jgi:hypothetical protein
VRVVLLALASALAVVGCERGPVVSERARALEPAPALVSSSAAASGSIASGSSATPVAGDKEEPLIEVNLDGRAAEGSADPAAEEDGPEGHGDDEPMDDVDDTTDISGAPISGGPMRGSEGDDPAVQADEKAVEKPLMKGP